MRKRLMSGFGLMVFALCGAQAFAAGHEMGESMEAVATNWGPLAAALAIGLGAFGAASAQGRAASAALEGVARNPSAKGEVFTPLILSLVFMELQALLCFVIAFMVK